MCVCVCVCVYFVGCLGGGKVINVLPYLIDCCLFVFVFLLCFVRLFLTIFFIKQIICSHFDRILVLLFYFR